MHVLIGFSELQMLFQDLLGVSLILPLILPMVKDLGISHMAAGAITSLYGAIQLLSSPSVVMIHLQPLF